MDTIAAIATPPGRGGVGIIRLSGPLAYTIGCQLSRFSIITPRVAHYTSFYHVNVSEKDVIDQGLILYFKAPASFTGEDVLEIQAHGSPIVLDQLLSLCIHLGARLAKPGEFSERAFLNDKMDLTQAEAIADLIQASSQTAARLAVRTLQGDFSKKIHAINEQLIQLRLYIEASIDFSDEAIDLIETHHSLAKLEHLIHALQKVQQQACQGCMLREGLSIVISGLPNVGKSTLMNALAKRSVAIVTDIAGTTRDLMREPILIDDLPIHLIDTAGLRDSTDVIEQEGIKLAWGAIKQADCILMVADVNHPHHSDPLWETILSTVPPNTPMIRVMNKIDQQNIPAKWDGMCVYLSAKSGEGLSLLTDQIKQAVGYQPTEGSFLARRRHLEALNKALTCLLAGAEALATHQAIELLAEELRLAHQALSEITGEFTSDDLLGKIFASFCIGK